MLCIVIIYVFITVILFLNRVISGRFYKKKEYAIECRCSNWNDIIASMLAIIADPCLMHPTLVLLLIAILGNGMQHGLDIFNDLLRLGILAGLLSVILHFSLLMRLPPYPFYFYSAFLLITTFHSFFLARRIEFLRKKAESQAQTDELTGLMNRRAFFRAAKYLFSLRERLPLTIIVIYADLDKFKKINDTMGHDMGDRVLCKFAELLKTGFRGTDIISRYGGDEFVLLLIDIDIEKAGILMGRIDKRFTDWGKEGGINVGISWGMKTPKKDCNDIDEILKQADEALYEEKIKKSA
ncbi:MAG: sensor domain-containing diguanylate cyclase [Desulfobacteraceae bacterium]|nr:MAG: sensor domain-containing diguanylate cyclase [Desulfobacteraceae bacterium]